MISWLGTWNTAVREIVPVFIEFAFDTVTHRSDSNLGCNFYCNKKNSMSLFH